MEELWSDVTGVLGPLKRRFQIIHMVEMEDKDVPEVVKPPLKRNNAVLFTIDGEENTGIKIEDDIIIEDDEEPVIIDVDEEEEISIKSTSKKRKCNRK